MIGSKSRWSITALVAALSGTGCGGSGEARGGSASAAGTDSTVPPGAGAVATNALTARADSARIQGSPEATLWVVEVSDFQCPYCRTWHEETYATLKREYIDAGKIRFAYVNFPLSNHKHAWPAAEVAMCAGLQGKFWEVQDVIFRTQDRWAELADASAVFDSLAAAAGVDTQQLRACTGSDALRPLIQADYERGMEAGVSSTPSFLVGDEMLVGAQPIEKFREVIDAALESGATAAPGRGSR